MAVNEATLALADSVGLVVDRTVSPEVVLGQACLIGKNRVLALASAVFNYADAPWALAVRFPHPDLTYAVRSISIHPDFNRREARTRYLSQTGVAGQPAPPLENDIASLSLDPTLAEMRPEGLAELNGMLSLQIPVTGQDRAGSTSGEDIAAIVSNVLAGGREGLLTFFDERNLPLARLAVKQGLGGFLKKIIYRSLAGELALFELVCRRPRGAYLFQPDAGFSWPNIRDIESTADRLLAEAGKRASELPALLGSLGGAEARYIKAADKYNPEAVHPNARWIVERLWVVLDGYISLDKLSERVGADTYTVARAVQEMLRLNLVAAATDSPFRKGGQLGSPFAPSQGTGPAPGDQLTGFYLDPLSARPVTLAGQAQGAAGQANAIVHTVPFPPQGQGAAILQGAELAGLNTGPAGAAPAGAARPYLMVSMGAIGGLGSKRLRQTTSAALEVPVPATAGAGTGERAGAGRIGRFICPACRALNLESGFCAQCGADLETGQMPAPASGERSLRNLQKPFVLSRRQMMMGGAGLLVLAALAMMMMSGPKPAPRPAPTATPAALPAPPGAAGQPGGAGKAAGDVQRASEVAVTYAGFKDKPPDGYVFEDTTGKTSGTPSFALSSEHQNIRVLFVIFDSVQPVAHLELVTKKVPYTDYQKVDDLKPMESGESHLGSIPFNWIVARYPKIKGNTTEMALVGAFRSPVPGKSIVLVGQPLHEDILDYKTALWLVETMAAPLTAANPLPSEQAAGTTAGAQPEAGAATATGAAGESAPPNTEATPAEKAAYVKLVESSLKSRYSPPREAAKKTVTLLFGVDEAGKLDKLELSETSGVESFDNYIPRLVSSVKFPPAPHVSGGSLMMRLEASGSKLKVTASP